MRITRDKLDDILHRGNTPLAVGITWSIFGITLCPCPVCLLGSLSMLTLGLSDKFGLLRYIKQNAAAHRENCDHHLE